MVVQGYKVNTIGLSTTSYTMVRKVNKELPHSTATHMSQLLRVDPSALASSPPATGWRPARRGRPGATRAGCDLYTFILWAGSTRRDREGGSCSVLYSDLLRAVGTPVPGEMINGASHYGGSPLILLTKDSRTVAREHEGDLDSGA